MSEENTNETTDEPEPEPTKSELHERVEQLESTVEKMMPSRRDALKLGAAGIAGAAGLSATSQSAAASTGSAGQIGDSSNRPDIFADDVDTNTLDFGSVSNKEIIQSSAVRVITGEYVVGTSSVEILDGAQQYFAVVSGRQQSNTDNIFVDTLLAVQPGSSTPTVANSKNFSADARSYGNVGGSTPMSMAANTYDVEAVAFSFSF